MGLPWLAVNVGSSWLGVVVAVESSMLPDSMTTLHMLLPALRLDSMATLHMLLTMPHMVIISNLSLAPRQPGDTTSGPDTMLLQIYPHWSDEAKPFSSGGIRGKANLNLRPPPFSVYYSDSSSTGPRIRCKINRRLEMILLNQVNDTSPGMENGTRLKANPEPLG